MRIMNKYLVDLPSNMLSEEAPDPIFALLFIVYL